MTKKAKIIDGILVLLIVMSLSTKEAHAYLDPGTSSYLLQILFAGFFTALLAIKTFWRKAVLLIKRALGDKSEDTKNEEPKSK